MFPFAIALFIKSMILGVGISAPMGPNGMLMVNRTIRKGFRSGFFSGMGLATADTIFALIAGLGFSFVIGFIDAQIFYIKLFTGIFVALMGLKIYLSNPVREIRRKSKEHNTHFQDYWSLLLLALTNPFSIFVFIAFFTGFNIDFSQPGIFRVIIILGIFIGAGAWWLGVSYVVNHFSGNLRLRSIVKLNKISGTIITLLGLAVLIALLVSVLA